MHLWKIKCVDNLLVNKSSAGGCPVELSNQLSMRIKPEYIWKKLFIDLKYMNRKTVNCCSWYFNRQFYQGLCHFGKMKKNGERWWLKVQTTTDCNNTYHDSCSSSHILSKFPNIYWKNWLIRQFKRWAELVSTKKET